MACNEPAQGFGYVKKMGWHSPWLFLLILAGLFVYLIVALVVHRSAKVRVALCPRHRRRRQVGLWLGFGGMFLSMAFLFSAAFVEYVDLGLDENVVPIAGLIGLFGFPIVGVIMTQMIRPRRIDHEHVWLRVGRAFADSIPERE